MAKPFLYCCPTTGLTVQGETDLAAPADGEPPRYEGVLCLACNRIHVVNPHTGRLLSEEMGEQ